MNLKLHLTNKIANVGISIFHVGKNDYQIVFDGIGTYSKYSQLGTAVGRAMWLEKLDQEDLNWEIAKIQNANSAA